MLLEDFNRLSSSQVIYKSTKWKIFYEFKKQVVAENEKVLNFAELFVQLEAFFSYQFYTFKSVCYPVWAIFIYISPDFVKSFLRIKKNQCCLRFLIVFIVDFLSIIHYSIPQKIRFASLGSFCFVKVRMSLDWWFTWWPAWWSFGRMRERDECESRLTLFLLSY